MTKPILMILAGYFALLAAYLVIAPLSFYHTIPGVSATGPYNDHFTRDVGLAFLISAAALFVGAQRGNRLLALFGAAFPVLHGIFHVVSWGHQDFPNQINAIGDLMATAGLAALTLFIASKVKGGAA